MSENYLRKIHARIKGHLIPESYGSVEYCPVSRLSSFDDNKIPIVDEFVQKYLRFFDFEDRELINKYKSLW